MATTAWTFQRAFRWLSATTAVSNSPAFAKCSGGITNLARCGRRTYGLSPKRNLKHSRQRCHANNGFEVYTSRMNEPEKENSMETITMESLVASKTNPRKDFDKAGLTELAGSIKEHGILQPILVRPVSGNGKQLYEIVAGERRNRASKMRGLTELPAIVSGP